MLIALRPFKLGICFDIIGNKNSIYKSIRIYKMVNEL
jgi:hypothetical protein